MTGKNKKIRSDYLFLSSERGALWNTFHCALSACLDRSGIFGLSGGLTFHRGVQGLVQLVGLISLTSEGYGWWRHLHITEELYLWTCGFPHGFSEGDKILITVLSSSLILEIMKLRCISKVTLSMTTPERHNVPSWIATNATFHLLTKYI